MEKWALLSYGHEKKWAKDPNRCFSKEDIQAINKHRRDIVIIIRNVYLVLLPVSGTELPNPFEQQ